MADYATMQLQLIDRIYESAFVPELWPGALDGLAAMADARGGVLLAVDGRVSIPRWAASDSLRDLVAAFVAGDWLTKGRRLAVASTHAGFLAEQSSDDALAEQPMYRDFLRPLGLGWSAGSALPMPTGDMILISVERDYARGRMEPEVLRHLDAVRPHLARSALLSSRLQMERARAVSDTLGALGLPALVFDSAGAVLAANPLIEGLSEHVRWLARHRVSLKDPGADALFGQAVATLDAENAPPARSFAVRGAQAAATRIAHVIPVRGAARDIFTRCAGVLVLTPASLPKAPPVELVRSLFDLTAAEARVARSLAAGDTVGEIAEAGGGSINTVRAQVRGVLEKTGCHRQAEVVALLGGIVAAGRHAQGMIS
jgi:DNA-binding CsgD family transcriptional regulator